MSRNKGATHVYTAVLSNKPKKACFTLSITLKLWNDLTMKWNDLTMGNEVTVKPWSPPSPLHPPSFGVFVVIGWGYLSVGGGGGRGDRNKNGTSLNRRISLRSFWTSCTNLLRQGEGQIVLEDGKRIRVNISIYFHKKVKAWFLCPFQYSYGLLCSHQTDDCSDTKNELTCPITNPIWHLYEP